MKSRLSIFFLLLFIVLCGTQNSVAQDASKPNKPKVVVHIVVDQMRTDYVQRFWDNFGPNGIKRLVNEGYGYKYVTYPYQFSEEAADYASLVTGTTPSMHGINAYYQYNEGLDKFQSLTLDNGTQMLGMEDEIKGFSAKNMMASTVGDELRKTTFARSKVYSVSMNKEAAVLLAGHVANGAYWLDNETGEWVTSSYYIRWLPQWVKDRNALKEPDDYMDKKWDLFRPRNKYYNQTDGIQIFEREKFPIDFRHQKYQDEPYRILKSTPYANQLITNMAIELMEKEEVGLDNYSDLIYVNYAGNSSDRMATGPHSIRTEDMIYKLDQELEKLLAFLDKKYGVNNYLVVLSSTQGVADLPEIMKKTNLPAGTFDPKKAFALLNSFLMAKYGQGKWILTYNNKNLYFNHELIKSSKYTEEEIITTAASFLEEFSGIAFAYTAYSLKSQHGLRSGNLKKVQNVYYPGRSGDILLSLKAGWNEKVNDALHPGVACDENLRVPLVFYGWKVKHELVNQRASMLDVAPTLSDILGVTVPNESTGDILDVVKDMRYK